MLTILSPGSGVISSALPQAGHFEYTSFGRLRPFDGTESKTIVRIR
jgi:hypothetical protein